MTYDENTVLFNLLQPEHADVRKVYNYNFNVSPSAKYAQTAVRWQTFVIDPTRK